MRSVSVLSGNSIYLIGGHNRERNPSKEIWMFERAYNTMRIVGLLREGRAGHAVCASSDALYVFGGSSSQTLE